MEFGMMISETFDMQRTNCHKFGRLTGSICTEFLMKTVVAILLCLWIFSDIAAAKPSAARVSVRVVSDEADAVLAILAKKKAYQSITEADWQRLFSSEGYIRLKK